MLIPFQDNINYIISILTSLFCILINTNNYSSYTFLKGLLESCHPLTEKFNSLLTSVSYFLRIYYITSQARN